jgi:hypothetical protein
LAGYIFSLNNVESLHSCIRDGIYSTILSPPNGRAWGIHHEGTFADYLSMKPGDNVYFFIKRNIYGIGEMVNVGGDCKYLNYPGATQPTIADYSSIADKMILNYSADNLNNRCLCFFKPSPNFFTQGIDMDDVLASNPRSFRILRAFWKLSFIKIDDEENKALRDIILKRNEQFIYSPEGSFTYQDSLQNSSLGIINEDYTISSSEMLCNASSGDNIRHEMAIEAGLIDILTTQRHPSLGKWDYISHQVIASPFKAIDYMDKMDIFGYKYIPGFDTISKYLLIEIKKDTVSTSAINQIMKYVDWINQEYAFGDYSMISAFLVGYDFSDDVISYRDATCIRNFMKGARPSVPVAWKAVTLLKYSYNNDTKSLDLIEV